MKRIFLLVLVFISLKSYSQYPVNQILGSDSTIITSKGAFKSRLIHFNFVDTLDANSQHIDEYPGAHIFTVSDNKLWYRSADTSAWLLSIGGGRDTIGVTYDLFTDSLVNGVNVGHQVIHRFHSDGLISGTGIVSWTGTGLTFAVSPAIFFHNGNIYNTPADTITLDPADPTDGRIDAIAVDTIPDVIKITGTASPTPVTPQEEVSSQIILATILLNAGDLVPSNVAVNKIYDENIEWTTSTTGTVVIDYDDTNNPYIGTKAAFVSEYNNNSKLLFTYSGTETVDPGETLKLFFYSNGAFTNKLRIQFFTGAAKASESITLSSAHGLNPLDSNNYQNISIPLSAFKWFTTTFNRLVITHIGSDISGTKGYYLDNIQLQTGVINIPPSIDYSNKVDSVTIVSGSYYYWIKGIKYLIGTAGSTRFGIEDVTGVQHRSIDMDAFNFTFTNPTNIKVADAGNNDVVILSGGVGGDGLVSVFKTGTSEAANLASGYMDMTNVGGFTGRVSGLNLTAHRFVEIPNADGTLALSVNGSLTNAAGDIVITADNGLTWASNNVKLGGTALSANTTIPTSANSLTINSSSSDATFTAANTGTGIGLIGVHTTGTAIYGSATTGTSISGEATTGYAGNFHVFPTSTNTVVGVVKIRRSVGSGSGANGIGGALEFYTELGSGGSVPITNTIVSKLTDVTAGTYTSQLLFTGKNSAAAVDLFKLDGNGDATVVNLAGTGSRTVLADANGVLSAPVSDKRLKTNISPVSKWVDVLSLLKDEKKRGVFYNWKDHKKGTAKEIGFVAQGFEDIKGMTGTMNNTGYKYMNYDRVTAILWEQNRLLLERIEALEKMLNDLLKR